MLVALTLRRSDHQGFRCIFWFLHLSWRFPLHLCGSLPLLFSITRHWFMAFREDKHLLPPVSFARSRRQGRQDKPYALFLSHVGASLCVLSVRTRRQTGLCVSCSCSFSSLIAHYCFTPCPLTRKSEQLSCMFAIQPVQPPSKANQILPPRRLFSPMQTMTAACVYPSLL